MPLLKVTPILFPVTDGLIVLLKPHFWTENPDHWKKFTPFIKVGLTLVACMLASLVSSFALVASLTGSLFSMVVSVILPAAAHWARFRSELSWFSVCTAALVMAFGAAIAIIGTVSAIVNLA